MSTRTRRPGEFCWINMLTPEPERARDFFAELLGWTYVEMTGVAGHAVQVGGRDIGGVFDVVSPGRPTAVPMIGVMVKVDSVDATVQKVAAAGGKATDGFDIMDAGRMAVCHDPNGAQFDLWQPKRMQGTDVDAELPGAPSWFETMTTDVDRATEFYE